MIFLKKANMEDAYKEWQCHAFLDEEAYFDNHYRGMSYEDFRNIALKEILDYDKGIGLPKGYVEASVYYLWHDDEIVGIFNLRKHLNEALRDGAGHIGYVIRKDCREKGYASFGLALALQEAEKIIPEDEIYMSVNKTNTASLKVQLKNGATIHHSDDEYYYTRIKKASCLDRKYLLDNFYTNICNEDTRLESSRQGKVEFITTTSYIDRYLKKGMHILEIGAGTGRYSLHYAEKGYKVDAIELVQHNIDILTGKIKDNMDITVRQGDALDLSCYEDNLFDVTLVLGPMYHLYDLKDVNKAIQEAIRVTKKAGIIAFAYLTNDSIILDDWKLFSAQFIDGVGNEYDEHYKIINKVEGIFSAYYIDEFKDIMKQHKDISFLHNVATDGLSNHLKAKLAAMNEKEFALWIKYHLSICERIECQGFSNHMLYICKKN